MQTLSTWRNTFPIWQIWREEFRGCSRELFQRDLLAGITVAAVALPLALAFGVASGATAAAGLVTAILAGFIIGGLGGAGYQISGPTGAMSAVLIVLANRYGPEGVWVAGLMAGAMIRATVFRHGQYLQCPAGKIDRRGRRDSELAHRAIAGHNRRWRYRRSDAPAGKQAATTVLEWIERASACLSPAGRCPPVSRRGSGILERL
jgi:hypothetical protein